MKGAVCRPGLETSTGLARKSSSAMSPAWVGGPAGGLPEEVALISLLISLLAKENHRPNWSRAPYRRKLPRPGYSGALTGIYILAIIRVRQRFLGSPWLPSSS